MFARCNAELSLVRKDVTVDKSTAPGGWCKSGRKPGPGSPGKTSSDKQISRRHKTGNVSTRVGIIIITFCKLSLEGEKTAQVQIFPQLVSVYGRQIEFIVCFFRTLGFGFIQSVVHFQRVVEEMPAFFIIGEIVELHIKTDGVFSSGSPIAEAYLIEVDSDVSSPSPGCIQSGLSFGR